MHNFTSINFNFVVASFYNVYERNRQAAHGVGNIDEADALVRESLKLDDGLANAWDTLANILIRRGKLTEAEEAMQKAVAMQPGDPSIRASMVRLYDAQNRSEEAIKLADELLLKASELSPSDAQQLREVLKRMRGS